LVIVICLIFVICVLEFNIASQQVYSSIPLLCQLRKYRPCYNHPLDFACTFVYFGDFGIPEVAFHIVFLAVAVTTVYLQRQVRHARGNRAAVKLGHGGLGTEGLAGILKYAGSIQQQACCINFGCHVGDIVLDGLK